MLLHQVRQCLGECWGRAAHWLGLQLAGIQGLPHGSAKLPVGFRELGKLARAGRCLVLALEGPAGLSQYTCSSKRKEEGHSTIDVTKLRGGKT